MTVRREAVDVLSFLQEAVVNRLLLWCLEGDLDGTAEVFKGMDGAIVPLSCESFTVITTS